MYCNVCNKYIKSSKKLKYHVSSLSVVYSNCRHEYEKIFKVKESTEILIILGLINNIEQYQKIYNNV